MWINEIEFTYKLSNIYFHLNLEHVINDKLYDMEMNAVHKNINSSDINNLHLVIIFLKLIMMKIILFLNSIGFNTGNIVTNVNVQDIIKKENIYYYKGSLTTPPYTEDVNWVIVENIKKNV